jgi:hypothetical protein
MSNIQNNCWTRTIELENVYNTGYSFFLYTRNVVNCLCEINSPLKKENLRLKNTWYLTKYTSRFSRKTTSTAFTMWTESSPILLLKLYMPCILLQCVNYSTHHFIELVAKLRCYFEIYRCLWWFLFYI